MPWSPRKLREQRVWAKVNAAGELVASADRRVDVRYQRGGKVYRAAIANLVADGDTTVVSDEEMVSTPASSATSSPSRAAKSGAHHAAKIPSDAVQVYTDGACSGNPGPMGIGIVILDGKARREVSEYLGEGTNNVAELTAILRALELSPRDRPIYIHSDSAYALGLLGQGWKAKANQTLVAKLRAVAREFSDLHLVKVAGHSGVPENERCDELAVAAVKNRS